MSIIIKVQGVVGGNMAMIQEGVQGTLLPDQKKGRKRKRISPF